jgi:predicted DCC family thiol-disulfide oxidoreductase YuxK
MRKLTILYDASCSLCRTARAWLEGQRTWVELEFLAAGSPVAGARFPELSPESTLREIAVVSDDGRVYRGGKAWVMCLWATVRYRELALRLASPELLPWARRVAAWVASHRRHVRLPRWIGALTGGPA